MSPVLTIPVRHSLLGVPMENNYRHTVLIVDDNDTVGRAIEIILKTMDVDSVYAPSGEIALEKIQAASPPFSLIISDQRMPGISGYELFERAREISPDSVRFLISGYSDMVAIIEAINRGAIHRFIPKPWQSHEFAELIAAGLKQYELVLENERLLNLAKQQNMKLYKLSKDLKEKTEERWKALEQLDREIDELNQQIPSQETDESFKEENSLKRVEQLYTNTDLLDKRKINVFFNAAVQELHELFQDIASRNGFNMPKRP